MTQSIDCSTTQGHRGFTLIEMMVAIVVSIFLAGGLLMMVQSTRNAFGNQQSLAQLQDNERLVMTFMAEVTESAGYFPDPVHNSSGGVFLLNAPNFQNPGGGQAVYGTHNAAAPGDQVWIRYAAAQNDNTIFNCRGTTNTAVAPYDVFVNEFSINAQNQLICTVSSTTTGNNIVVPLVNGITNLQILYGVKRSVADTGSCADTYLTATQMTTGGFANDWLNVCSISITMTFINPINAAQPIVIQRVIATMNAAGVNS
jgi:type IV pilus assembly protein PilW